MEITIFKYAIQYRAMKDLRSGTKYWYTWAKTKQDALNKLEDLKGICLNVKIEKIESKVVIAPTPKFISNAQRDCFYNIVRKVGGFEHLYIYNEVGGRSRLEASKLIRALIDKSILFTPPFLSDTLSLDIKIIRNMYSLAMQKSKRI